MSDNPLVPVLVDSLRATINDPRERAALELLVWHESWINRLANGLEGGRFLEQDGDLVVIRWTDLYRYATEPSRYSRTEIHVVRFATSLAAGTPVHLRDVLSPDVGPATRRAMATAFTAAAEGMDNW